MAGVREATLILKVESTAAEAKLKDFAKTLDGVTVTSEKTRNSVDSMADSITKGMTRSLVQVGALTVGITSLSQAFLAGIRNASQSQDAQLALERSLRRTNDASKDQIEQLKRHAEWVQRLTVNSDEDVMELMAWSHNMGVTTDSLDRLTTSAVGLSELLETDLSTAYSIIIKAGYGYDQVLNRHGIYLDENLTTQEKLNEVLRRGAGAFSLAEERAQTASGKYKQMKEAVSDLAGVFGSKLLGSLTDSAGGITNWVRDNESEIEYWAEVFAIHIGTVKDSLLGLVNYGRDDFNGAMGAV